MGKIITIPKEIAKKGELVLIPRSEYEGFLRLRKAMKSFKTFTPTKNQKEDLKVARQEYKKGNHFTINELKQKLEIKN